jgi:hypothetical protein
MMHVTGSEIRNAHLIKRFFSCIIDVLQEGTAVFRESSSLECDTDQQWTSLLAEKLAAFSLTAVALQVARCCNESGKRKSSVVVTWKWVVLHTHTHAHFQLSAHIQTITGCTLTSTITPVHTNTITWVEREVNFSTRQHRGEAHSSRSFSSHSLCGTTTSC